MLQNNLKFLGAVFRTCSAAFVLVLVSVGIPPAPPANAETNVAGRSVFLDPGHSGVNDSSISRQVPNGRDGMRDCQTTGTSTNNGFPEHVFNWDVVLRIQDALQGLGVQTGLSRTNDNALGPCVDQRAAEANAAHPDAIVSIHADGGPPWGSGFHVNYSSPPLYPAQRGPALQLADTIRDFLSSAGFNRSDYVGSDGLYGRADLAGLNFAQYPAVLVELGNMRNPEDSATMETVEGRARYAQAVTNGIVAYLQHSPTEGN